MYSFCFKDIVELASFSDIKEDRFDRGTFLWIWYANKIPPHIGISCKGKYCSLKVNGKDFNLPVSKIKELISAKRIGVFIVELNFLIPEKNVDDVFRGYKTASSSKTTCLKPICQLFDFKEENAILADLLNYFNEKKIIKEVFSINLEEGFSGILQYGTKEIEERLIHLENVKRQKNIPQSR